MQATMAVLGTLGWRPIGPDKWISRDGEEYAELAWSEHANAAILDTLADDLERVAWHSASNHFLGSGLESGTPSLDPARSARQWLRKRQRWKEVKALDVVVCGGVWGDFRKDGHEMCERCGAKNVDAYHRYWSCPNLLQHSDEAVVKTQWLN